MAVCTAVTGIAEAADGGHVATVVTLFASAVIWALSALE